jgi:hypothetical protein
MGDVNWIVMTQDWPQLNFALVCVTTDSFQMMVSLDVIPCSLVDRYQTFRGTCCVRLFMFGVQRRWCEVVLAGYMGGGR